MSETFDERVEATMQLLINSCREWDITIAGDMSVTEGDTERLIGYSPGALRAQRQEGKCRMPRRLIGNRWRYRLSDIAAEFEKGYENA
ncbi:hypothetical protein EGJ52_03010 [Pseudomonas luteola]|uniref:hypothetical protein n=1 Tax=Pseudomonas luteola TaxID=47886 RepID=UPI000F78CCDB|nr:hypothetical protein [Pseudomonas luteola]RRW47256.1 hypothetical protein EGJ52_03010 [Pseudomonas luteola]